MSQNPSTSDAQSATKAHSRIDSLEKKLKAFEERLAKLEKRNKKPASQ